MLHLRHPFPLLARIAGHQPKPKEILMVLTFRDRVLWLLRGAPDSAGQTLVEYSLILAFVAGMVIAIATLVGGTNGLLDRIGDQLTAALS